MAERSGSLSRLEGLARPSLALVWGVLPIVAAWGKIGLSPVKPNDYWWPMVQGRAMEQLGSIPSQSLYLYTLEASSPFVNQPWLSQWLMYKGMALGGHDLLVWVHALLWTVSLGGLMALCVRRGAQLRWAGALFTIALAPLMPNLVARTRMFAYPCIMLMLWGLYGLAERRLKAPLSYGLIGLSAAWWANVHGSFMLAPLLTGAFAVGVVGRALWRERALDRGLLGRWAAAVGLAIVAPMLNPQGPKVYLYALNLMTGSTVKATVTEWQPFALTEAAGVLLYSFSAVAVCVGLWRRRRLAAYEVVASLGLLVMALNTARHALWWPMLAAGVLAMALSAPRPQAQGAPEPATSAPAEEVTAAQGIIHWVMALSLILSGLGCMPGGPLFQVVAALDSEGLRHHPRQDLRALSQDVPMALLEDLARQGEAAGRLFHWQDIGGAVEYVLAPDAPAQVAFVDQRMELIPEPIWDDYFLISRAQEGWRERLAYWQVEAALLHREEQGALVKALLAQGWFKRGEELDFVLLVKPPKP